MKFKMEAQSLWRQMKDDTTKPIRVSELEFPKYHIRKTKTCKRPDGITQSLIVSFLKCRRNFLIGINRYRQEKKARSFAFGSITHDTLDKIFDHYMKKGKLPKRRIIREWCYTYDKDRPNWLPESKVDEIERFKAVCFVMVTEYIKWYADDFKPGVILGAEDLFDNYWRGYRLRGKKDLRFRKDGKIWIKETKTAARIEEETMMQLLAFDFQNLFYVFNEELESGEKVNGVLRDVVRNPGMRFTDQTLRMYCKRLRADVQKRPDHYFKRYPITYYEQDKKAFKQDLICILRDIENLINAGAKFAYKNPRSCAGKFPCANLKACSSGKLIGYKRNKSHFSELEGVG